MGANASHICTNSQMSAYILRGGLANTLECCHNDMCNYKGLHDLGRNKGFDKSHRQPEIINEYMDTQVQEPVPAKEMWFWAAMIAVPIAGGFILSLLIMMTLQMLRSENKRLEDQRQQMLSRLHYSLHGHHTKKRHVAKPDLECMVPITGHENCYLTYDKVRQVDLDNDTILSLVHWGMYSGHDKQEFV